MLTQHELYSVMLVLSNIFSIGIRVSDSYETNWWAENTYQVYPLRQSKNNKVLALWKSRTTRRQFQGQKNWHHALQVESEIAPPPPLIREAATGFFLFLKIMLIFHILDKPSSQVSLLSPPPVHNVPSFLSSRRFSISTVHRFPLDLVWTREQLYKWLWFPSDKVFCNSMSSNADHS